MKSFFGKRYRFEKIAQFVKQQKYPLTLTTYKRMTQIIFGRNNYDSCIAKVFQKSVDAFDTSIPSIDDSKIEEIRMTTDYMLYTQQILMKKTIYIVPAYQDMRKNDIKLFRIVACSWIQRTIGILTKHEIDAKPMTIIFKESHEGQFVEQKIPAIIPDCKFSSIICSKIFNIHFLFLFYILS